MLRKNEKIKDSNKEGRIKVEMDSGAVKELSMKSSKCHPNPLEPEGEQPDANMVDNKMVENMKNNYLKEADMKKDKNFPRSLFSLQNFHTKYSCLNVKNCNERQ